MRFDYTGRAQIEGRVKCEKCTLPMLGIGETDLTKDVQMLLHLPYQYTSTYFSKTFCDCPEVKDVKPGSRAELEAMAETYMAQHDIEGIAETYIAGFLAGRDAAAKLVRTAPSEAFEWKTAQHKLETEIKVLGEDTD